MMSLNSERMTDEVDAVFRTVPIKGSNRIFKGALVALSAGLAIAGTEAVGLAALGRAEETVDNRTGADGARSVRVKRGTFHFDNHTTDPVSLADVGVACFIADDHTIARTNGSNTRSIAGTVFTVDADGVWVTI